MTRNQDPKRWTGPRKVIRDRLVQQLTSDQMNAVDDLLMTAQAEGASIQGLSSSLGIKVRIESGDEVSPSWVSLGWLCSTDSDLLHAQGNAAVFGSHFRSEETRRGGQVGRELEGWRANFQTCPFAHRPPGWKPRIIPSDRWQVEYADLPEHLEEIEGWMTSVIAALLMA